MNDEPIYDVVVIGAGLAGATAAEALSHGGRSVLVLEARDRSGGRAYARPFANTGQVMEFGGAWITPWHMRIREACRRHGVSLRSRHPNTARRWFHGGALRFDAPAPEAELDRYHAAIQRVQADALAYKAKKARYQLPFARYLAELEAPPIAMPKSARELCLAWWSVSGNGDPERVAASEFLASCAYGDGRPDSMMDVWADTLEGGVGLLVDRMLSASRTDVLLNAPVRRIARRDGAVDLHVGDGRRVRARAAILATGLNPLRGITFDPPLGKTWDAAISAGHLGRAIKVWIKAQGLQVGTLATGGTGGINWMFVERETDGHQYAVGFGMAEPGFDPNDQGAVNAAFQRFFPEGRLVASDWYDWNADPYSLGTWVAPPVTIGADQNSPVLEPERLLAFASSDIAEESAGWFEGAMHSGKTAADRVEEILRRDLARD